jgi:hypothetical protein
MIKELAKHPRNAKLRITGLYGSVADEINVISEEINAHNCNCDLCDHIETKTIVEISTDIFTG